MEKRVFMVMPFGNMVSKQLYEHSIKPVCDKFDLRINCANEKFNVNPIYDDIVADIQRANLIIVDLSDKNPNVFYELGIVHTLKQNRTIMITQGEYSELPFDIAHFRIINYENTIEGKQKFEAHLEQTIRNLLSDVLETFKDELELTIRIFMDAQKTEQLLALLGVQNYTGTLSPDDKFHVEGAYPPDNEKSNSAISVLHGIKPMLDLGHISIENNIVSLTEKGKALAELLTQKGFVCNSFLDQTYTENYKPLSVRIQEQYKPK